MDFFTPKTQYYTYSKARYLRIYFNDRFKAKTSEEIQKGYQKLQYRCIEAKEKCFEEYLSHL